MTNLTVRYVAALLTIALIAGASPFFTMEMFDQQEQNRKLLMNTSQLQEVSKAIHRILLSANLDDAQREKIGSLREIENLLNVLDTHLSGFKKQAFQTDASLLNPSTFNNHVLQVLRKYQPILALRNKIASSPDWAFQKDLLLRTPSEDFDQFQKTLESCRADLESMISTRRIVFKRVEWTFSFVLLMVLLLQGLFVLKPAIQKVGKTLLDLKLSEQKESIAKEEAVEALKIRSEFVTKISHEIRNPLNAILGIGDLLLETRLDMSQKRYVEIFRRAGQSILDLINDFLDFSRLEAGKLSLEKLPFDLIDTAERAIDIVANRAEDKGLELNLDLDPNLPIEFLGDSKRIQQILVNLLSNAIKFTNTGEVFLGIKQSRCEKGKVEIVFCVSDTGIGIATSLQSRIFDNFVQADSSITRKFGGNGLGLAISQDLTKMMGGRISLQSELGTGSNFSVFLPLEPKTRDILLDRINIVDLSSFRVLILDQSHRRIQTIGTHLSRLGAHIESRTEFVSEDDLSSFNLILVDQVWITEILSSIHNLNGQTRVICFSKLKDLQHISNLLDNKPGFFCIQKPVKLIQLVDMLNDVQEKERGDSHPVRFTTNSLSPTNVTCTPSRILIVEDSNDNRLVMQAYLSSPSFKVTFAVNGRDGVQKFKEGEFDVIFMDIQMPEMDGFAAARAIRQLEIDMGSKHTPIIALSAYGHQEEIIKCINSGCDKHLTKPIRKITLLQVIEGVLKKDSAYDPLKH